MLIHKSLQSCGRYKFTRAGDSHYILTMNLADWGLIEIVDLNKIQDIAPLNQIKVLAYKDKGDWILETKYNIGSKKKKAEDAE